MITAQGALALILVASCAVNGAETSQCGPEGGKDCGGSSRAGRRPELLEEAALYTDPELFLQNEEIDVSPGESKPAPLIAAFGLFIAALIGGGVALKDQYTDEPEPAPNTPFNPIPFGYYIKNRATGGCLDFGLYNNGPPQWVNKNVDRQVNAGGGPARLSNHCSGKQWQRFQIDGEKIVSILSIDSGHTFRSLDYDIKQCLKVGPEGITHAPRCHGKRNQRWLVNAWDTGPEGFLIRVTDERWEGQCLAPVDDAFRGKPTLPLEMIDCVVANSTDRGRWYVL